jgi:hypothetical protein
MLDSGENRPKQKINFPPVYQFLGRAASGIFPYKKYRSCIAADKERRGAERESCLVCASLEETIGATLPRGTFPARRVHVLRLARAVISKIASARIVQAINEDVPRPI